MRSPGKGTCKSAWRQGSGQHRIPFSMPVSQNCPSADVCRNFRCVKSASRDWALRRLNRHLQISGRSAEQSSCILIANLILFFCCEIELLERSECLRKSELRKVRTEQDVIYTYTADRPDEFVPDRRVFEQDCRSRYVANEARLTPEQNHPYSCQNSQLCTNVLHRQVVDDYVGDHWAAQCNRQRNVPPNQEQRSADDLHRT